MWSPLREYPERYTQEEPGRNDVSCRTTELNGPAHTPELDCPATQTAETIWTEGPHLVLPLLVVNLKCS